MKTLLLLTLLLPLNSVFGQKKDGLFTLRTDELKMSGSIDEKYAITVYLKYYQSSGEHRGVYSVTGWYYYDNIKKKIPLVGLYEVGDLTLFVFQQKEKRDSILEFKYGDNNLWSGLEVLKNISGYDEKFSFGPGTSNEWITPKKTLGLQLYGDDLSVERITNYLETTYQKEAKYVNLDEVVGYLDGCELINSVHSTSENSFLIKYEYASNWYVQGRCGAGTEEGYVIVRYDNAYNLVEVQDIVLYSCYDSVMNEAMESSDPNLLLFKVTDSEEVTKTISIHTKTNKVVIK